MQRKKREEQSKEESNPQNWFWSAFRHKVLDSCPRQATVLNSSLHVSLLCIILYSCSRYCWATIIFRVHWAAGLGNSQPHRAIGRRFLVGWAVHLPLNSHDSCHVLRDHKKLFLSVMMLGSEGLLESCLWSEWFRPRSNRCSVIHWLMD